MASPFFVQLQTGSVDCLKIGPKGPRVRPITEKKQKTCSGKRRPQLPLRPGPYTFPLPTNGIVSRRRWKSRATRPPHGQLLVRSCAHI